MQDGTAQTGHLTRGMRVGRIELERVLEYIT